MGTYDYIFSSNVCLGFASNLVKVQLGLAPKNRGDYADCINVFDRFAFQQL